MYSIIRIRGTQFFLRREAPALIAAFLIAEMFYKFGSFALECVGFLATWFVLSFLTNKVALVISGEGKGRPMDG